MLKRRKGKAGWGGNAGMYIQRQNINLISCLYLRGNNLIRFSGHYM
jgi:hypothetical protein